MRDCQIFELKNGIRIAHNRITTSKIVHCGLMLDVGSRDETEVNQGIAHFWEHMAFKGTRKRKAFHILNRLESLGGELNAFTDKEKILFYASVRDKYFERAMELLADITFDSVFPEKQINRERNVILEEMSMYYDDPDDSLQDEFDNLVFQNHPLGMNILGTEKTVRTFRRKDFRQFINMHLDTSRIVFSSVGDISSEQVLRLAAKHLGGIPTIRTKLSRKKFSGYKPQQAVLNRDIRQSRCAIGSPAYKLSDKRRVPFYMLTNILGGNGMNSRLNMALREKHGFVYSIGANYIPFTDTGLFSISFGTIPQQVDRCVSLVRKELKKLRKEKLGVRQLASAKEQVLGQIAMAEESNIGFMMIMARNLLDLNRIVPLDEVFKTIDKTTSADLVALAGESLDENQMSYLTFQPNMS